jgi:hypothetical protein
MRTITDTYVSVIFLEEIKMKKIIALVLALCMVLALAACGAKTKTAEEGKLIMATNAQFPPYESLDGTEVIGFDPDMMRAVCDKLGYELKIENMDFDSRKCKDCMRFHLTGKKDVSYRSVKTLKRLS